MAAFAWLLGGSLGGPSVYFGSLVEKEWLGPDQKIAHPWDQKLLTQLFGCLQIAGICGMFTLWASLGLIGLILT